MRRIFDMHKINAALAIACTMALGACATAPLADPAIGDHWPTEVAFDTPPPRAEPTPGSACEIANQYVTNTAADRSAENPKLFAKDGALIAVEDRVLHGAELANFFINSHVPGAIPLSFIDRGDECIMEIAGMRPNLQKGLPDQYRLVAIDHFTLDSSRHIKRLVIFFRFRPYTDAAAANAAAK